MKVLILSPNNKLILVYIDSCFEVTMTTSNNVSVVGTNDWSAKLTGLTTSFYSFIERYNKMMNEFFFRFTN